MEILTQQHFTFTKYRVSNIMAENRMEMDGGEAESEEADYSAQTEEIRLDDEPEWEVDYIKGKLERNFLHQELIILSRNTCNGGIGVD